MPDLDASVTVKNAMLDAVEVAIGTAPVMKIRTGSAPGITAADSGTVLASLTLPSDWMAAAASGSKALTGTWQDLTADAAGTAGHFRIYASNGTTQHLEGSCTVSGGGGHLILNTLTIDVGELFSVEIFTLNP